MDLWLAQANQISISLSHLQCGARPVGVVGLLLHRTPASYIYIYIQQTKLLSQLETNYEVCVRKSNSNRISGTSPFVNVIAMWWSLSVVIVAHVLGYVIVLVSVIVVSPIFVYLPQTSLDNQINLNTSKIRALEEKFPTCTLFVASMLL